jgi:cyclophilin family peptidyl-prolyl cis-trans isomerase
VVPDFVIQGGGFEPGLEEKPTRDPIANEGQNGLRNVRGGVAMARTDDPDSATAQFFVNLVDNPALDATLTNPGYAVFGRVIEGMDVVDAIGAVSTEDRDTFTDVPVEDVVILHATIQPGEPVLTPAWEAYLEEYRFSALSGVRDVFVTLLGSLIAG